jgi:iron complex outermembrane receptor protein
LYFSYAKAHREPNRTDYENGTPKPEKLNDFELGWRYNTEKIKLNLNGYYMAYKDQLVLTGKLDDVGSPIRENSGDSYRLGIEADAKITLSSKWTIAPNISISESLNKDFYTDDSGTLESLGNTNIAYAPKFIIGNIVNFSPVKNINLTVMSKFVGKQYLNNINDKNSYLSDYFINDFSFSWDIPVKKIFKEISISALCNNILNRKYVSNAFDYGGGYIYYYPQAGANFLTGVTLKF